MQGFNHHLYLSFCCAYQYFNDDHSPNVWPILNVPLSSGALRQKWTIPEALYTESAYRRLKRSRRRWKSLRVYCNFHVRAVVSTITMMLKNEYSKFSSNIGFTVVWNDLKNALRMHNWTFTFLLLLFKENRTHMLLRDVNYMCKLNMYGKDSCSPVRCSIDIDFAKELWPGT